MNHHINVVLRMFLFLCQPSSRGLHNLLRLMSKTSQNFYNLAQKLANCQVAGVTATSEFGNWYSGKEQIKGQSQLRTGNCSFRILAEVGDIWCSPDSDGFCAHTIHINLRCYKVPLSIKWNVLWSLTYIISLLQLLAEEISNAVQWGMNEFGWI